MQIEWPGARLEQPLLTDMLRVCLRLEDEQRLQWEALEGVEYDPEALCLDVASKPGPKWALVDKDGHAFAVGGFVSIADGVWQDWLLTTSAAWTLYPLVTTKACRQMVDALLDGEDARRVQAMVLANREKVRAWYRTIGYEHEGTLRAYAPSGEDVVIYGKVSKHG